MATPLPKCKLTKSVVAALAVQEKRYVVMCQALPGFGVRVLPASRRHPDGQKVFFVRYRVGGGRDGTARWMRLGPFSEHLTVEKARREAQRILQRARDGHDPSAERVAARTAPTVADLCDRYLAEYAVAPNKAASSIRMDQINIRLHVKPQLGKLRVDAVQRQHIRGLKTAMRDKPGAANRVMGLVSRMMTLAEEWDMRPENSNPCRGVQRYKERRRERFLKPDERQRLETVLRAARGKQRRQAGYICQGAIDVFRLLSMTGARLGEIVGLQWSMVDLHHGCLRLPDSKEGPDKVLLVSEQTLAYLQEIRDRSGGSRYVCPNEDGQRQQNIQSIWRRVRKAAGLDDVNLHALRHSFISDAVTAGVPLFIAGRMAGHKSPQTTQRYAHLEDEALRRALATTGRAIAERSQPREGATVLRLAVAGSGKENVGSR